ncbi:MAG TPA: membrane protein insertase YidC [Bacteroidia bacterium]|nr:membrane protein insertase YidC [Bacteroidia bacterium]
MDKNSFYGLLVIGAVLLGWMYYMQPSKAELDKEKRTQDSIVAVQQKAEAITKAAQKNTTTSTTTSVAVSKKDSTKTVVISDSAQAAQQKSNYGAFAGDIGKINKDIVIENDLMKVTLSTLGGRISSVQLKKYKTSAGKPLMLFTADSSSFGLEFSAFSKGFSTDSLYFTPVGSRFIVSGKDSSHIAMRLYAGDSSKYIEYVYTLIGNSYMMSVKVNTVGLQNIIASNDNQFNLNWHMKTPSQENSLVNQKRASTIYYRYDNDDVNYISERKDEKKSLEDAKLQWVSFKQQFFTSVLIADHSFEKPNDVDVKAEGDSSKYIKSFAAELSIPYNHNQSETFPMHFYFGPNDFKTLLKFNLGLEHQVPLGWGILRWINRYVVINIFDLLSSFGLNYGIVILILTLVIKLCLFPVVYKTYLSSAKMRVLKPEIDEIGKKFPKKEDALKKQQATMALYKKVGVNPLAGCIPMLFQMPILYALFEFFPSAIQLRQKGFLWCHDLSTYDSIYKLHFTIPFYGDHVSLFTLLMTVSTLLYTWSNNQLMGTNNQMPGMKWMMYLMPIMFLGFFNNYSAGLSYYYFLANMITFGQTMVMRKFVDEDELHRKLQENKKKPVKVSNFQKRLAEISKQQQAQRKK